jgi:hypothetical protein
MRHNFYCQAGASVQPLFLSAAQYYLATQFFTVKQIIERDGLIGCLCRKFCLNLKSRLTTLRSYRAAGINTPENVKIACEPCNSAKNEMILAEYLEAR